MIKLLQEVTGILLRALKVTALWTRLNRPTVKITLLPLTALKPTAIIAFFNRMLKLRLTCHNIKVCRLQI